MWDAGFDGLNPEADDYLHNPDPKRDRKVRQVPSLLVMYMC
jgi:hypothetical protein